GGKRNRPLLLMFSLLDKAAVAKDLQVYEPRADRSAPQQQHYAEQVEAGILSEAGAWGRHDSSFSKFVIPNLAQRGEEPAFCLHRHKAGSSSRCSSEDR